LLVMVACLGFVGCANNHAAENAKPQRARIPKLRRR
jgi:hypothetical protein